MQERLSKFNSQFQKFLQNSWPINWSNLTKPKLLLKAFIGAPNYFRVILVISVVGIIISLSFTALGVYLLTTEDYPTTGGTFYEAVFNQKIQRFNPVLATTSEAEQKINSLLYHPLYKVEYPDYLNDSISDPVVTPVLLNKAPEWKIDPASGQVDYRTLRFELRDDIFWSNGDAITSQDVFYSFNRLKETGGHQDFNTLLQDYQLTVTPGSTTNFEISPTNENVSGNPQLIYSLNFRPISQNFYNSASNSELLTDFKSLRPTVSSGFFVMNPRVTDPDNDQNTDIDNPIIDQTGDYRAIVLSKNEQQNDPREILIQEYVLYVVSQLDEAGGDNNSLERLAKNNKLDLFSRFLNLTSVNYGPEQIKSVIDLNQEFANTNTYHQFFINIQPSAGGLSGYFINDTLRKYVICNLLEMQPSPEIANTVEIIPVDKRILPVQLANSYNPDCTNIDTELTELTNSRGSKIYSIEEDERAGVKRVQLFGRSFGEDNTLKLVGLSDYKDYGLSVQAELVEMGLPSQARWVSQNELQTIIKNKDYHFLFLPVTIVSRDPYSLFGSEGQNLSNITTNERVNGEEFEETLKTYSESSLLDQNAKTEVVKFFQEKNISINLFRSKQEFNYSDRIEEMAEIIPQFQTFSDTLYYNLPTLHIETKRGLKS